MAGDITNWAAISSPSRCCRGLGGHFVAGEGQLVQAGTQCQPFPKWGRPGKGSPSRAWWPAHQPPRINRRHQAGAWGQVAMAILDLAVTPRPCHPGGSWALRLEVKNTRRTLVLSKVKCVTRQREKLKITRVYTPQILGFPGQSQESICGRKGDSQAKAPGHPKTCRGVSGPPASQSLSLRPVGLAAWAGRWGDRPYAGWPLASWAILELARLRMTLPACVMASHGGGGTHDRIHPLPRRVLSARCCSMSGRGTGLLQTLAGQGNLEEPTRSDRMERGGTRQVPPTLVSSV